MICRVGELYFKNAVAFDSRGQLSLYDSPVARFLIAKMKVALAALTKTQKQRKKKAELFDDGVILRAIFPI